MAFQANTNINALNAHVNAVVTQRNIKDSLEKLSSGLRINKAADDASGMIIADSLRSQASALGQAIANTNDAMGIIQIADKAMDEQLKILDTIKVKAVQAAQDGQTSESRRAIQSDIVRLIQGLDMIGNTTSFNGQKLLSGAFTNKEFQVGAYSNESIKASIGATTSDKIGQVRVSTGGLITASNTVRITFKNVDGINDVQLQSVKISTTVGTGIGVLAEVINKSSDKSGIRAVANVISTSDKMVASGTLSNVVINGLTLGDINDIKAGDSDGRLVQAFNAVQNQTGVEAFTDEKGRLNLRSVDGRGIKISVGKNEKGQNGKVPKMAVESLNGGQKLEGKGSENYGRLSLVRLDSRDIVVMSASNAKGLYKELGFTNDQVAKTVVNLRDTMGAFNKDVKSSVGANFNAVVASGGADLGAGVMTLRGAMVVMDIAESATKILDRIRADLGSVQGQMISTVNNISVTQVNVKAAESQIREVDFAQESANFNKLNILAQSGSFAMSQANAVQQHIIRLLQ
ncbi:flagellin A [Helicobacter saguini]|uniref:Flagellin n=1 Tax=Helicobacter saguini TaxID=1548018 RepID=A0A347VJP6_9HELI|nr:flagellin A [Helicobacter saguini]MWV63173.1 flagellin A [Helicobacter saguini]MWV66157.1 flagellin A [Helicobacter saguini]MWV68506.1 flagellin A [Helicobacter saguini]MWV71939.1 flagellin A [Helicobacter saguini]TLD95949.1 flagellin A [Helicobacter saguini]